MMDMHSLEQLLSYGFFLFPVTTDKKPLTKNGWKDASNKFDQLQQMFDAAKAGNPQVAIACGQSHLFVLDV